MEVLLSVIYIKRTVLIKLHIQLWLNHITAWLKNNLLLLPGLNYSRKVGQAATQPLPSTGILRRHWGRTALYNKLFCGFMSRFGWTSLYIWAGWRVSSVWVRIPMFGSVFTKVMEKDINWAYIHAFNAKARTDKQSFIHSLSFSLSFTLSCMWFKLVWIVKCV